MLFRAKPREPHCDGDCLGISELVASTSSTTLGEYGHDVDHVQSNQTWPVPPAHIYQPLHASQTRLIRIPPSEHEKPLSITLLTVDVTNMDGLRLAETMEVVHFTALSYRWLESASIMQTQRPTVICNGVKIELSHNVHSALVYHQRSQHVYLWIDAICINQADMAEKATQVAQMLAIFVKASSVTAWLGPTRGNGQLAFACLNKAFEIRSRLNRKQPSEEKHLPRCHHIMRTTYEAILCVYEDPFHSRTWIRQELYAARTLRFVCGGMELDASAFGAGEGLLTALITHNPFVQTDFEARHASAMTFLREIKQNRESWVDGKLIPRDLLSVLITSEAFGATLEQDTVYAILGMCGISITTQLEWRPGDGSFLVDYTRAPSQIYHDMSIHLLSTNKSKKTLGHFWQFYGQPGSTETPSWVVDWRRSRCKASDVDIIRRLSGHYKDVPDPQLEAYSALLPHYRRYRSLRDRHLEDDASRRANDEEARFYEILKPRISANSRVLEVTARAVNYVACVTNYSCSLEVFMRLQPGEVLRRNGTLIHGDSGLKSNKDLFVSPLESAFEQFDPGKHDRRIAVLGMALDQQLALVPAATLEGDLVVILGEHLLPMALSPVDDNKYARHLFATPCPYDECLSHQCGKPASSFRRYSARSLMGFVLSSVLAASYCVTWLLPVAPLYMFASLAVLASRVRSHSWGFAIRQTWFEVSSAISLLQVLAAKITRMRVFYLDCFLLLAGASTLTVLTILNIKSRRPATSTYPWRLVLSLLVMISLSAVVAVYPKPLLRLPCFRRLVLMAALWRKNFKVLDHVTHEHNHRFRFRGPVFVRQDGVIQHLTGVNLKQPSAWFQDRPRQTFHIH